MFFCTSCAVDCRACFIQGFKGWFLQAEGYIMIFPQFLSPSRIRHEKLMLVDISCVGTYQGFQFDPLGITAGDRGEMKRWEYFWSSPTPPVTVSDIGAQAIAGGWNHSYSLYICILCFIAWFLCRVETFKQLVILDVETTKILDFRDVSCIFGMAADRPWFRVFWWLRFW